MSTLTIQIPRRLKSELSARAKASGKTVPQMVREMMERHLTETIQKSTSSLYDRSQDLCGSITDGPHDLARNKNHLAGYGACKR